MVVHERPPDSSYSRALAAGGVDRVLDRVGVLVARGRHAEANRCFNCGVCNGCEVCLVFCPDAAISRAPDGGFAVDLAYCKGCGLCAAECPRGAVRMVEVS